MSLGALPRSWPAEEGRIGRQLEFLVEIDRLKHVLRRTRLFDGSRRENDVEHSWHLALMAIVLCEHAAGGIDLLKVLKMVLVHDLVEIDAGDTFLYAANRGAEGDSEAKAARRIFGLLPADQARDLLAVWEEFEARNTPEARFAAALDRLEPLLQNILNGGNVWRENGIGPERVLAANAHIEEGSPMLWNVAREMIDDAVEQGLFTSGDR